MKKSPQNPHEIAGADALRQKLRDLVALLKNSALFETTPEDLAELCDGENVLQEHLSQSESALRFVEESEVLLAAARVRATRTIGRYRIARLDIAVRMERVLARLPDAARHGVHRADLRELLVINSPPAPLHAASAPPENVHAAPVCPGATTVELAWRVPVCADGCRFEIEAARSEPPIKPKPGKTIAAPLAFEPVGRASATRFVHSVCQENNKPPGAGTVLYYRVRCVNQCGKISA